MQRRDSIEETSVLQFLSRVCLPSGLKSLARLCLLKILLLPNSAKLGSRPPTRGFGGDIEDPKYSTSYKGPVCLFTFSHLIPQWILAPSPLCALPEQCLVCGRCLINIHGMDGWMDGQMDRWMDGWMNDWMSG
jgi:hypothetical protein